MKILVCFWSIVCNLKGIASFLFLINCFYLVKQFSHTCCCTDLCDNHHHTVRNKMVWDFKKAARLNAHQMITSWLQINVVHFIHATTVSTTTGLIYY